MTFEQEVESRVDVYKDRDHGYDKDGNLIYHVEMNGLVSWSEYNENGMEIHYKNSEGDEIWKEYDSSNDIVYHASTSMGDYSVFKDLTDEVDWGTLRQVNFDRR